MAFVTFEKKNVLLGYDDGHFSRCLAAVHFYCVFCFGIGELLGYHPRRRNATFSLQNSMHGIYSHHVHDALCGSGFSKTFALFLMDVSATYSHLVDNKNCIFFGNPDSAGNGYAMLL